MSGHLISCSEQPSLDQCFVITFTYVTNVILYYAMVQYIHHTFRQQDLETRWTTELLSVADLSRFIFLESFSVTWCDSGKCQTSHIWWRTASSHLRCSSLPLESLQACTHTHMYEHTHMHACAHTHMHTHTQHISSSSPSHDELLPM